MQVTLPLALTGVSWEQEFPYLWLTPLQQTLGLRGSGQCLCVLKAWPEGAPWLGNGAGVSRGHCLAAASRSPAAQHAQVARPQPGELWAACEQGQVGGK